MAGLFDQFSQAFDSEDEVAQSEVAQAVVQSLDEEDFDDELREAEKLLAKAAYYKAIVRDGIIQEDGTPQAAEVNAEARLWARQQMGKMLGRYQPEAAKVVEPLFTENEVRALKKLAGFALAKMGELPAEPVVRKVENQPPVPTVRKLTTPSKPKQQDVVKTSKPQQDRQPKTSRPQQPPAAAPAGKRPPRVKKNADGTPDYDGIPSGELFRDVDGNLCKMIDNPRFDPAIEGSKPRTKMKATNQVRVSGGYPPPTKDQLSSLSHAQSAATISSGTSASATSPFGSDSDATQDLFIQAAARSLT